MPVLQMRGGGSQGFGVLPQLAREPMYRVIQIRGLSAGCMFVWWAGGEEM